MLEKLGDFRMALQHQLEALAIWEKVLPMTHHDISMANANIDHLAALMLLTDEIVE